MPLPPTDRPELSVKRLSRAARPAAALAVLLAAPSLGAQQVPATLPVTASQAIANRPVTPFRKGQWGMEAGLEFETRHLGFLRFRSPTKAWVIDVGVGGSLTSGETVRGDTAATTEQRWIHSDVLLGLRSYRALTPRAVRTLQFGIFGGHAYAEEEGSDRPSSNGTSYSAGARFELGGAYFFTPGFSLGGTLALSGAWVRSESNAFSGRSTTETLSFNLDASRVAASLYF